MPGLDGKVDDRLLLAVVDAGEFGLLALLVDDLDLLDELGGDVLGGQLGVVQEEGLAVDGYLGDGLAVGGDGAVLVHLHAGKLLEQVLQHVVVGGLERGGVEFNRVLLDDDGVADGGYARGVQRLLVNLHLDGAEVHLSLDLDLFFVGLVAEQLAFEDIRAGGDLVELRLPVGGAQDILIRLGFAFLRQGNGREAHRLPIGASENTTVNELLFCAVATVTAARMHAMTESSLFTEIIKNVLQYCQNAILTKKDGVRLTSGEKKLFDAVRMRLDEFLPASPPFPRTAGRRLVIVAHGNGQGVGGIEDVLPDV